MIKWMEKNKRTLVLSFLMLIKFNWRHLINVQFLWYPASWEAHWHIFQNKSISVERIEFTVCVCGGAFFRFQFKSLHRKINNIFSRFFHRLFIAAARPLRTILWKNAKRADAIQLRIWVRNFALGRKNHSPYKGNIQHPTGTPTTSQYFFYDLNIRWSHIRHKY